MRAETVDRPARLAPGKRWQTIPSNYGIVAVFSEGLAVGNRLTYIDVARIRDIAVLSLLLPFGCDGADSVAPLEPTPELVSAVDVNPDPDVVEINLAATVARVEYLPGVITDVLAYRDASVPGSVGTVPGPLIDAKQGDRLIVHFENEMPTQFTTVHWHGLRLPAQMDGNPMVSGEVGPGERFEYDFVLRDAGLFWYHPHVDTDEQVELGLQGPLVVRSPDAPAVDRERYFALDDTDLAGDGSVVIEPDELDILLGRRGDTILVNGKPPGAIDAATGSVERWRFVNTSNGRFFRLSLGGATLRVIGWDGGFVDAPYDVAELLIAPGERYDVLVELDGTDGRPLSLHTLEVARGHDAIDPGPIELLRVSFDGDAVGRTAMPDVSRAIAALSVDAATVERSFELTGDPKSPVGALFFINGERWPLNTPVEATLGDIEIWEVVNDGDGDHPFHIHGVFFQVLDTGGEQLPALGWKDTTILGPRSSVRLAVEYTEPGMWMFHCQIPEHAERGMMGDLRVTDPNAI